MGWIMKKKTKIIIISLIVLIIIITAILVIVFWPKNQEKSYTKKEIIEEISKGFVNGISKGELEELMNQKVLDITMMMGEDAYLLQTPSKELIDKYKLDTYVKENKRYFASLERKIRENYSWKFDGETKANQDTYLVTVKTYQYGVYLADLEVMESLLTQNYSFENAEDQEINNYKAKIIAMKLLNSHLDDYISDSEPKTTAIFFKDIDSEETKNSLAQYIMNLSGYANGQDERINDMEINRTQRMQEYIDAAINDGTLDQNDILKI